MNKLTAAVAAVLLGTGLAGTAHATAEPVSAPSGAPIAAEEFELVLSVSGSDETWYRAVVLTCPAVDSPGHPDPAAACAEVVEAGGDFDGLPGDRHMCTKEYDPVTAEVFGTYQDRPVSWRKTYPSACVLDSATGTVFRF
ncbi:SSI family serine proteinase inhibitor [Streptomyces sp. NPDC057136]|uniref:SSI family serine proteinase inhibitor n=1 Tax=Streptomyces sp. NPDC057136 TaxID=3346029 RepID=UPI003638D846